MGCFNGAYVLNLIVTIVIICALVAIVRLLLPRFLPATEPMPTILAVLQIIIWAVVVIAIVYFAYDLITCAAPLRLR